MPKTRLKQAARALIFAAFSMILAGLAAAQTAPPAAAGPLLLVLNKAENTLALVDPSTMKVVGRVPTGEGPHEVVVSQDGKTAFVSNYGAQKPGNSISIIDLAARKETKRVDLGPFLRPHGLAERGGKIYFTSELARAVVRYDPAADKIDLVVGTGQIVTHMLVMHPKRPVVYTANIFSNTASVIELDKQEQPGPPPRVTHVAVGPKPEGLDVSPDGRELWVGHNDDGGVSVIDTETHKVKETFKAGGMPIRIKFTPDGKYALITSPTTGELAVFDAATRKELKRFQVGEAAVGVVVSPDSRRAYVASMASGKVTAVNLEDMTVAGSVETGKGPDGLGWAAG